MNARDIEKIIAKKHEEDIFVPQCKTGATQKGVLIFDAWVMVPSWASPRTIGYEIKVSRGDFLSDNKWRGYLPFCNEFNFVVPKDLIEVEEVPENVGLYYINGSRMLCKKKAQYREIGDIDSLLRYIIFYHSNLIKSGFGVKTREERIEEWERWLESKIDLDRRGYQFSKALQEEVRKQIKYVKDENDILKHENEKLQEVKDVLTKLGIQETYHWDIETKIKDRLEEIQKGFSKEFLNDLNSLRTLINRITEVVNK